MISIVLEASFIAARNYLRFERNYFGQSAEICLVSCPYILQVAIVYIRKMIESTVKIRSNLTAKTKNLLHSLRWLFCATAAEFSSVASPSGEFPPDKQVSMPVEIVEEEDVEIVEEEDDEQCDAFTFQCLPIDCKLRVFSFLSIEEKGRAERVCSDWKELIRTPQVWNNVDLTRFSLCCQCPGRGCSSTACYDAYKDRTEKFLNYLVKIRPNLKEFHFAFDINDCQDDWLRLLRNFIDSVHLQQLHTAQLNWKETPVKPYPSESATWSSNNYNDLMYRHRRRQRHFVGFFDYFTALATNLSTLILPFDWSACSIRMLGRLQRLETLVLESYFVPQPLQQETLDDLLHAVPNLKHLTVTVCIGSGLGMLAYKITSKTLKSLDLSRCQGFSLEEVNLPSLTEFRTSSKAYICPLLDSTNSAAFSPCVYEVLCAGAPGLVRLNDHNLRPEWRENCYEELGAILKNICACPIHKPT